MAALQRAITPELPESGASTWLLRCRTRGWDGGSDKIDDARWALDEVRVRCALVQTGTDNSIWPEHPVVSLCSR